MTSCGPMKELCRILEEFEQMRLIIEENKKEFGEKNYTCECKKETQKVQPVYCVKNYKL